MTTVRLDERELRRAAEAILGQNDRGSFIAPGPHQYPGQWNWDAALVSIGLVHIAPERARHEISQLLRGQWDDGLLPHIVFWEPSVDYFPGPDIWAANEMRQSHQVAVTGITQPPVLATAVRILHERHPDRDFLERVVPTIELWHKWLTEVRRPESGLVSLIHPWESGMDNSPRFDEALRRVPDDHSTPLTRGDVTHVTPEQRPTEDYYRRCLHLVETLRASAYRPILDEHPFVYGDIGFTSILVKAEEDLAALWREVGDDGAAALDRHQSLRLSVSNAWDNRHQAFLDHDYGTGSPVPKSAEASASLLPLYSGAVNEAQAAQLRRRLWDESSFGPTATHPWGITSVAKSSLDFEPHRYWRGPVWININWFLVRGLQSVGFEEDARRLRSHTLDLVAKNGIFEYYHPQTGQGLGSPEFSWTAALTIDLLERP